MKLKHYLWKYLDSFLDGFSSRLCYGCKQAYSDKSNKFYCETCYEKLHLDFEDSKKNLAFKMNELHEFFGGEVFHYPRVYFATEYNDLTKSMMREFKYRKPHYGSFWLKFLQSYLAKNRDYIFSAIEPSSLKLYSLEELPEASLDIFITEMPMHYSQKKKRGFNQAQIISQELSMVIKDLGAFLYQKSDGLKKITNIKVNYLPDLFIRSKNTAKLFDKNKMERLEILRDAFELNSQYDLANDSLLLVVDDISTTGASFLSIYKSFIKSRYYMIDIIFLALTGKN